MNSIFVGMLFGAAFGLALWWSLFRPSSRPTADENQVEGDPPRSKTRDTTGSQIMDRWSVRLAIGGFALGAFYAFTQGWATIGFMLGFGLPFSAIGLVLGLVIDWIKKKQRE